MQTVPEWRAMQRLSRREITGEICRQLANALRDKPCRACIAPLDVRDLATATPVGMLPGVAVVWEDVLRRIPPPEA